MGQKVSVASGRSGAAVAPTVDSAAVEEGQQGHVSLMVSEGFSDKYTR